MVGFHAVSDYTKVSFCLVLFTIVVHVVSYGSPYWTTRFDGHAGLWAGCSDGLCYDRAQLWIAQWIKVCQAFMSMAIATLCGTAALLFFYTYTREFFEDKRMVFVAVITASLSALFTFITISTWAGKEYFGGREALNWGYALAVLSCFASIGICGLLVLELREPTILEMEKPNLVDASMMMPMNISSYPGPGENIPLRDFH